MSIKTNVTIDNNRLLNSLVSAVVICRNKAAFCLFLNTAMKTVAYLETRKAKKHGPARIDCARKGPISGTGSRLPAWIAAGDLHP